MPHLFRPTTPLPIQLAVILRQLGNEAATIEAKVSAAKESGTLQRERDWNLVLLANMLAVPVIELELHHRPALTNRRRFTRKGRTLYEPDANEASCLFYLPRGDHDVETRVRGLRGAHSDLGLARKFKNIAKNRNPKRRRVKIAQRDEYRWPSRPFRNRNADTKRKP